MATTKTTIMVARVFDTFAHVAIHLDPTIQLPAVVFQCVTCGTLLPIDQALKTVGYEPKS